MSFLSNFLNQCLCRFASQNPVLFHHIRHFNQNLNLANEALKNKIGRL